MKRFKWNFFLLTFYNFLRVPLRQKVLEHFSTFNFARRGKGKQKKTSRRHSSKLAQAQNLEKERNLNIFFNISLDLEYLCGAPFYFIAG